ncbi:MAG: glutathione S-transferase family protein [Myxococcota bacterium]
MTTLPKLYQFALCPFCNKVRAALEIKGIAFDEVEVSPRSKVELPPLPEEAPRKVPVLTFGDDVVWDSTRILAFLDEAFPDTTRFQPEDAQAQQRAAEVEAWVDETFIASLPPVLYGTWREAAKAAKIIAAQSRFSATGGLMVKVGGPLVMHAVAKRILARNGRKDAHGWVGENLDHFERELGEGPFVLGDRLSVADVAMQGALTCLRPFPIFERVRDRPRLMAWYERIEAMKPRAAAA